MVRKNVRRVLILATVGPAGLALLTVLGWQGKGYPWWRYLVVIVAGGYLVPVFGTLAGWKLLRAISRRVGLTVSFLLWALVGMAVLIATFLIVHMGDTSGIIFFHSWGGLLLLAFFGV